MNKKLLKKAIKKAGNQSKLALHIGCSRNFISLLVHGKKKLSAEREIQLNQYLEF